MTVCMTVDDQSGKKRDFGLGRNDSKKSLKTSPGSPVASARVSPAPESKSSVSPHGPKDAAPIPARDGKQVRPLIGLTGCGVPSVGLRLWYLRQLFDAAYVASLLDVARSALQEEAVRFVLVVLVMRSLDPKVKANRETVSTASMWDCRACSGMYTTSWLIQ